MTAKHTRRQITLLHFYIAAKEKMMHTNMIVTFCTASVLGGALIAGSVFAKAEEKTMSD